MVKERTKKGEKGLPATYCQRNGDDGRWRFLWQMKSLMEDVDDEADKTLLE